MIESTFDLASLYEKKKAIQPLDFPELLWRKDFDTDEKERLYFAQRVSDGLLSRIGCFYSSNINRPENHDVYWSRPDVRKFKGNGLSDQPDDYAFFHNLSLKIRSRVLKAPNKISIQNLDYHSLSRQAERAQRVLAEQALRQALGPLSEAAGTDMSFLSDPEIPDFNNENELFNYLNEGEQIQTVLFDLVRDSYLANDSKEELVSAVVDGIIDNAFAAEICTEGSRVYIKRRSPGQLSWMGRNDCKNLDEAYAIAVHDLIPYQTAIERYGYHLLQFGGIEKLRELNSDIKKYGRNFQVPYDVMRPIHQQLSPYNHGYGRVEVQDSPFINDVFATNVADGETPVNTQFGSLFWEYGPGNVPLIMEQKFYCRVVKEGRYATRVKDISSSSDTYRKPTEAERKLIVKGRKPEGVILQFKIVDEDYQEKEDDCVIVLPLMQWYKGVRLGPWMIVSFEPYEYDEPKLHTESQNVVPIILQNGQDRSIVTCGKVFANYTRIMWSQVQTKMTEIGPTHIKVVYRDQIPDTLQTPEFIAFMEASGWAIMDRPPSTVDKTAQRPVDVIPLPSAVAEIISLMGAIQQMRQAFDTIIGPIDSPTLINQEGLGSKQLINQAGSEALAMFYANWQKYANQCVQRLGDIVKYEKDGEKVAQVKVAKDKFKVLGSTKGLSNLKCGFIFSAGFEDVEKGQALLQLIPQLSGSDLNTAMGYVEAAFSDDPMDKVAFLRQQIEKAEQVNAQQAEAQSQQAATELQHKIDKDITVPRERIQADIQMKQMEIDGKAEREDAKNIQRGQEQDIKETNEREQKVLDKVLETMGAPTEAIL